MNNLFMVIDVESIGLHGQGFAVAWVVVKRDGECLEQGYLACDPALCEGPDESRLWVAENVPPLVKTCNDRAQLLNEFWEVWRSWADEGAVMVADCGWPVETNFLSDCVKQDPVGREWTGPYPLYVLASICLVFGLDPTATRARLADEMPAHHPLMDARQTARQLLEVV